MRHHVPNLVRSVLVLEAFRWLVLNEGELRLGLLEAQAPIEQLPLGTVLLLAILLLLLLLLGCHCELLKLVSVHFHVRADDLVRDCSHSLVPVLLL